MIGSIQHDLAVVIAVMSTFVAQSAVVLMLGSAMSYTLICRGMSFIIADASVASESTCLFFPRATWVTLVVLNFAMICFATFKYSLIRESCASKLPCT